MESSNLDKHSTRKTSDSIRNTIDFLYCPRGFFDEATKMEEGEGEGTLTFSTVIEKPKARLGF